MSREFSLCACLDTRRSGHQYQPTQRRIEPTCLWCSDDPLDFEYGHRAIENGSYEKSSGYDDVDKNDQMEDSSRAYDITVMFQMWKMALVQALHLRTACASRHIAILGERLPNLFSLRSIRLYNQSIDASFARLLVSGLEKNNSFRNISFHRTQFVFGSNATESVSDDYSDAYSIITYSVAKTSRIKKFQMMECDLQGYHVEQLVNMLRANHSKLTLLNLSNNRCCTFNAAKSIASWLLQDSCKLENLCLSGMPFKYDIIPVLDALFVNKSLKHLEISSIDLCNDGVLSLAQILQQNESITLVDISANNIADNASTSAFMKSLETNKSLRILSLEQNHLDTSSIEVLTKALKRNFTLRQLYLAHNPAFDITNAGSRILVPAVEKSPGLDLLDINCPPPPWSSIFVDQIRWNTHLNWAGRRLFQDMEYEHERSPIPQSLWPRLLKRVTQNESWNANERAGVIFYLINRGPVMLA